MDKNDPYFTRRRYAVTVTAHEQYLLMFYRFLAWDQQRDIDKEISIRHYMNNYQKTYTDQGARNEAGIKAVNREWKLAFKRLKASRTGEGLAHFVNCWRSENRED